MEGFYLEGVAIRGGPEPCVAVHQSNDRVKVAPQMLPLIGRRRQRRNDPARRRRGVFVRRRPSRAGRAHLTYPRQASSSPPPQHPRRPPSASQFAKGGTEWASAGAPASAERGERES
jgi:hypothetical protein